MIRMNGNVMNASKVNRDSGARPRNSKTHHYVKVDTDTGDILDETKYIGDSIVYVYPFVPPIKMKGSGTLKVDIKVDKCANNLEAHFTGTAESRFAFFIPAIDYDLIFKVDIDTEHGKLTGLHDGFPSYYAGFLGSSILAGYIFVEQNPASLAPPMEIPVNVTWP